jgi:hypothetical protein
MDQLRGWFSQYDSTLAQVRRFWAGEGRALISIQADPTAQRKNEDEAAVRAMILPSLERQAALPGISLPAVVADWGTVSTARYWGGALTHIGEFVHIEPVAQTLDDVLRIAPLPVDDPAMDAQRALARFAWVRDTLNTDALWLRTPDMQGVLNTAGLVMNQEEMLIAMFTEPDRLHQFLDQVCDFLIDYARYLRTETGGRICGNIWPYTFLPDDLGVALTEDMMPLLSADQYREFGIPYLKRINDALGGLHIHCCGDWGRHVPALVDAGLDIAAVEFHYPATTIEELAPLAERGVVLIPYLLDHKQDRWPSAAEYYQWLLAETPAHYRYWFALVETPEVVAYVQEHAPDGIIA